jgi:hypothetical protein
VLNAHCISQIRILREPQCAPCGIEENFKVAMVNDGVIDNKK